MKEQLMHIYEQGQFTSAEAKEIMLNMTAGKYNNEEVAAFLMALNMRNLVVSELVGFREAMLERALPINLSDYNTIDIVGTGGDGKNSFNISTCTSFVVAGAGYNVAKHGSYAVSSTSGSANVLLELGVNFTNEEQKLKQCIEEAGICFLFAPNFHPAMKYVVPIRKALRIKTIFNILGPLINPSHSSYGVFGVYSEEVGEAYSQVLQQTPIQHSIVFSLDGYDEVSLTGDTLVFQQQQKQQISPNEFNSSRIDAKELFGGKTVPEAAKILENVLQNNGTTAQQEVVLANAAVAIQTIQPGLSLVDCKEQAKQSIQSGRAYRSLQKLKTITNL